MDSSQILYDRIFKLPQTHEEISSLVQLIDELKEIKLQIKTLKFEGRHQQIQKKCFKNQKLIFISKILKQHYFKVNDFPKQSHDEMQKNIFERKAGKKQSQAPSFFFALQGSNSMPRSPYLCINASIPISQYNLKNCLISVFYNMLVNQKMLSFINQMSIPFYIYVTLLKFMTHYQRSCLTYKQTEKCLKFIYQFVKVAKENIPKVFIHLIKHFLALYQVNYEDLHDSRQQDHEFRIKLCYSYIFQTAVLMLKKNLFLSSKCGILSLLYRKCLQGALTTHKVEVITQIIIRYCTQQRSRQIIYNTIDLGKTFAIFTNVDMVQSNHEKQSKSYKLDAAGCCAVMIEMYLSNWPTLMYFLQQGKTLNNFIISLKRKSEQQIKMLNNSIFRKIMKRCINYNQKKIDKSKNIFNIQSNYLILKSLMILNYFYKHQQFKELIYGNIFMLQFKQNFIEILLQYFISNEESYKNREINKLLINNIKNINYYKKINIDISKRLQSQGIVNNNIQSYYSESLLPFQFNVQQLKAFLIKIYKIVQNQQKKKQVEQLLIRIASQYNTENDLLLEKDLLSFYKLGLQISQQIKWLNNYLDISKYLSIILQHLRGSKSIIDISQKCRQYIKFIFQTPQYKYFQYLSINILDDIGRYFHEDNKVIQYLNDYISDNRQAHKISRILLFINNQKHNQSIHGTIKFYKQICKRGSKALILQTIEIIKYQCEQNENRFLKEHLQILFDLIYHSDEDIVYSIIELLEEFVNKSKELQEYVLKIDMKKINHWNKRVLYLFLHYQNAILQIKQSKNPTFLKDQLQKWQSGQNHKKTFYQFVLKQLKKFTHDSILSRDYLDFNLDPSNYRKLIFLPWNIKINEQFYPIYIEYKNLQDKLKLKIYINLIIMNEIVIEELLIGSHNYTKYTETKHSFQNKEEDKMRLTLQEIKKEHASQAPYLGKEVKSFVITKGQTIFFINYDQDIYKIQRININIPLTLDTYRPLSHPLNYINLLCSTRVGFQFLKKQKFIDHCLQIIRNNQQLINNKDQYKGALICLGTLCASKFMSIQEKKEIYEQICKKFMACKNYEIQEICFWIINILIKDRAIRNRTKNYFILIQTKRCDWICLPQINYLQKESINIKERMANNIKYIKSNLPQKMDNEPYRYLYRVLNETIQEDISISQIQQIFTISSIDPKLLENIIKYVSVIDLAPQKIYEALHRLSHYVASDKFEQDYPNGFCLA